MTSPVSLILQPSITPWSRRADALDDLRLLYGSAMNSDRAGQWIRKFQQGDFSELPPVVTLGAERMPGLWGAYSREKNRIYLSAGCPAERLAEVLLEEVGHFLDRELCAVETPGEEGARFAAMVLGIPTTSAQRAAWQAEEGWGMVYDEHNQPVLVEGAKKKKSEGSGKKKTSGRNKSGGPFGKSNKTRFSQPADSGDGGSSSGGGAAAPVASQPPKPSDFQDNPLQSYPGETLTGSSGSTFVVSDPANVTIGGNLTGTETIQTDADGLNLGNFNQIENAILTGVSNISASGNSLGNVITGNNGRNTLSGREGNDTLIGLDGNDSLDGGSGNDSMVGGTGSDTFVVNSVADVVVEASDQGTDWVQASVSHTLAANVENLELTGSADINGTGNELGNSLIGNSGNNVLSGLGGNDTMLGGAGNDSLLGGSGEDLMDGGAGNDTMVGGAGDDTFVVDSATHVVVEATAEGTDMVRSSISYTLGENLERLVLIGTAVSGTGNSTANTLTGNATANSLDGSSGIDSLVGGDGNDSYFVDNTADTIYEESGQGTADLAIVSVNNYTLAGNVENLLLSGTVVSATGNNLDNTLTGNAVANSLDGGAGIDSLIGGAGNDSYFVDNAGDVVSEANGEGTDWVVASVRGYTLGANVENLALTGAAARATGNSLNNTLIGNASGNSLDGGAGIDTLVGAQGNDTYFVDSTTDMILEDGADSADFVVSSISFDLSNALVGGGNTIENLLLTGTAVSGTGNSLNNTLKGNSSGNILDGGTGIDTLVGAQGNDTYFVNDSADFVLENANEGEDLVQSSVSFTLGANIEKLTLTGTAVSATGNSLNNTLTGNAVGNSLDGGAGIDTLLGGQGNDSYFVDSTTDTIVDDGADSADLVVSSVSFDLSNSLVGGANPIENLLLSGTALSGTGNSLDNLITGNAGDNTLVGLAGNDTLIGGDGNDSLFGVAGNDSLLGGAGNDTIVIDPASTATVDGGADIDTLRFVSNIGMTLGDSQFGGFSNIESYDFSEVEGNVDITIGSNAQGLGISTLSGGTSHSTLTANSDYTGNVYFSGGADTDSLTGNTGNDTLSGAAGNDTLVGGAGNDSLDGGADTDSLVGGAGNDTYVVDSASDIVVEDAGQGTDVVRSSVSYTLGSNIEALELTGTSNINGTGDGVANTITGNSGNNVMSGLGGNDTIFGGGGDDTLDGGTEIDSMVGGAGNDTYVVENAGDVVFENTNEGEDLVQSSLSYTLGANVEKLTLTGTAVSGTGNSLANTLTGNSSGNSLDGGTGIDSLVGGDGNDSYSVDNTADTIYEESGQGTADLAIVSVNNYTLAGNVENLLLSGTVVSATGNNLNNTLTGNAVANSLDGGADIDTLIGGQGDDTYVVDDSADVVVENADQGTDLVLASVSYTLGDHVENLALTGSAARATGNSRDNTLTGNAIGNNLDGSAGIDTLVGGRGNDSYFVDSTTDKIVDDGADSADLVVSSVSFDLSHSLVGGGNTIENLFLTGTAVSATGNSLNNTLKGNSAGNSLDGGTGIDTLLGGQGNDTYFVDNTAEVLIEVSGQGTDLVVASANFSLANDVEKLVLTGTAVSGTGNSLANTLTGNSSGNSLDGGTGIDSLVGGDGDDTYFVDNADDVTIENAGQGTDLVVASASFTLAENVENLLLTGSNALEGTGNSLNNLITGNAGDNTLVGLAGNDTLIGGDGNDSLFGVAGNDSLLGGAGNDTIAIDPANSATVGTVDGGANNDTLRFISSSGMTLGDSQFGRFSNIESIDFSGVTGNVNITIGNNAQKSGISTLSGGASHSTLTANSDYTGNVYFSGGADTDSLTGNTGNDTLSGAAGNDILVGGAGNDSLDGGEGDDTLVGGNRNDPYVLDSATDTNTLVGGAGNDTYFVDSASDIIVEASNEGTDKVYSSQNYTLGLNVEHIYLGSGTFNAALNGGVGGYADTAALTAFGNAANNSLIGNDGDNVLDGLGGNDTMIGGAGNDTYYVGETGDWVIESLAGANYVIKAVGILDYRRDLLDSGTVTEITHSSTNLGPGNDTYSGTPLNDTIYGEAGNDSISGGKGSDILDGGTGSDTLLGESGMDTLIGGDDGDSLIGGDGIDSLVGGTGNDTYIIDIAAKDNIYESYQTTGGTADLIQVNGSFSIADPAPPPIGVNPPGAYAGIEALTYTGVANVTLTGNSLANTITSGDGADYIDGGAGLDSLIGGKGNDTYIYKDGDTIVESSSQGTDEVRSNEDIDLSAEIFIDIDGDGTWDIGEVFYDRNENGSWNDESKNIENIVLTGVRGIGATGNASDNSILGNTASNALDGGDGNDTLVGGDGDDLLTGGAGSNSLVGGSGNDTYIIDATANPDGSITIQDILVEGSNSGTDEIRVAADVDLSQLPDFENVVLTGSGSFNVFGNAVANKIQGNSGNNSIDGGDGADTMTGGAGNDTYFVNNGGDIVQEAAGYGLADLVISSLNSYKLDGNVENLQLIGGDGSSGEGNNSPNLIIGSASNNFLRGGDGDDTLIGGLGNDTLDGETDSNSLVGGEGDDLYIVKYTGDTIVDSEGDKDKVILLANIDANVRVNENDETTTHYDISSITFDKTVDTIRGGGAEIFLSLKTLESGDLNYKPYRRGVLLDGDVFRNPNYFYALDEDIEDLTVQNQYIVINDSGVRGDGNVQPDYIYGNSASNYINIAGEGEFRTFSNYIDGQGGADTMAGGRGRETYIVDDSNDYVIEAVGEGFDRIRSSVTYTLNENVEELSLLDFTETIVNGRPVASTLSGAALDFHGYGNAQNNWLYGNAGNNSLFGLDGNDYLSGHNAHDDGGGWGVDSLSGRDTLVGGKGDDTYYIAGTDFTDIIVENSNEGDDLVITDLASYSLADNVERLSYNGTNAASLVGNSLANTIDGASGRDTLMGGDGADSLFGGSENDSILGGDGHDTLAGATGNDTLDGGLGNDSLIGGDGDDSLIGSDGTDVLDGGSGNDTMRGGIGNDTYYVADAGDWIIENEIGAGTNLIIVQGDVSGYSTDTVGGDGTLVVSTLVSVRGGLSDDLLVGTPLKDTIAGDGGNDTITGVDGSDSLMGDAGNDSIAGGAGADTILGGADNDNLLGDAGNDTIFGEAGNDIILGGEDNDTLLGDAGNDTIFGEAGNDSILGGADADILVAGTGTDTLLGEAGNDTLVADATGTASLLGGDDSDSFGFTSGAQVLANTVVGGAGTDTLFLTATSTVTDAQLVNVSGVEAIQASSLASNSITLGTNAQAGGVASLFGGTSSDILSAAGMSSGNAWIQGYAGSGSSSLGDTLVTGTGTSRATLVGNNSATADNYYQISSASLLGNNSIVGGASSDDYLQITGFNESLSDASFTQVSDLDGLIITGGGNTITLGVTAQAKFGTSITLTGGESGIASGGDTINLAATTKKVWVNASARITGNTITAGSNSNTLIGGSSATANDLFILTNGSHLSGASIVGGGGTDTLRLSANGQTVLSAALTGLSSIEVFDLAGAGNNITLGAISAGISTIVGGTGPNTFDASGYNSAPNALTWNMNASNGSDVLLGGTNGNLFQIKNGANLQNSFITGNTGTDTIQLLAGAQTLGDLAFSRITSTIEKLQLGSATNGNSLTLGTIAAGKGIATIIGGTSHDTIDASAFTSAITIDASASSGSRLIGSTANGNLNTLIGGVTGRNEFVLGAISSNSLVGGSNGLDTLTLTQGGALIDTAFTPISKIGTLKLEGGGEAFVDVNSNGTWDAAEVLTSDVNSNGIWDFGDTFTDANSNGIWDVAEALTDTNANGIWDDGNTVSLGTNALIAGIRTLVGGEGNDLGTGNSINTSAYGSAGVLFQITDQDYLANITTLVGGSGIDTLKLSRDGVSVTDESVDNLKDIDVIQTANGTNRFLMHDAFYLAGIDSIIGGTGSNIIDMSHSNYDPLNRTTFDDAITFDMSAGFYSLIVNDSELRYAKVVGGNSGSGSVSITDDIGMVTDIMFSNLYDAKISSVSYSGGSIELGENAMATGMSILDITESDAYIWDFNAPLVINGTGNSSAERVFTSFAALANLTFNGGGGSDTLALEFSEARVITSLKGDFDVLALDGGNNFVRLGNDAGLSVIVGGTGADTLKFSTNTTGINFVMNASLMGDTVDDALITGGSGSDMLTIEFGLTTANTLNDIQFTQTSLGSLDVDSLNGFTTDTSEIGGVIVGQNYYIFDEIFDATGISRIFAHNGDTLDAGGASGPLNFILGEDDFPDVEIIGTAGDDTLTLNIATVPSTVTIADGDFALQGGVEFLVLNSVDPLGLRHAEFIVELGATAQAAGIRSVVGGNGGDSLDASSMTQAVTLSGGLNVRLDKDSPTSLTILQDTLIGGSRADSLYGDNFYDSLVGNNGADTLNGTSSTALGANEIDTLTGDGGNDLFVLGDATNAYYNTGARASDYALITDFAAGDKIQLKDLSALYSPTAPATNAYGYLAGTNDIFGVGALGVGVNSYIYADTDKNGAIGTGDNLIAAINTTRGTGAGGALAQADLLNSTLFSIV